MGATDRLAAIDRNRRSVGSLFPAGQCKGTTKMNLLVVFVVVLLIGQSIAVSASLMIERMTTPYTGLVTFIALYFLVFGAAWWLAVRLTAGRSSAGG
jgi:hypothetical protein